jgi:hypothetical protein
MPKVKTIEKRIWDIEGFDISFRMDGRDIRGDKDGIPQYPFARAAKNDSTVGEWKSSRFGVTYPGYDVVVLDGDGNEVPGQTKLGNVRDSYSDE